MKKLYTAAFLMLMAFIANAQYDARYYPYTDPDEAFADAREMAFNGKKRQASDLLGEITKRYPTYGDVRLFHATLLGWEERYKLARKEFQILLGQDKKNKEYWIGAIKNESWASQPLAALELSERALMEFPDDVDLTILKASAEMDNRDFGDAMKSVKVFLTKYPESEPMHVFKQNLKEEMATNEISVTYSIDKFTEIYDPMHYYTVSYSKETRYGSIVGRYNLNNKFDSYGSQVEIDAYPSLGKGLYAYVNVGYSRASIFPDWRYGFQLYKSLPASFEASLGIRSLKFGDSYTNIYTGSVGKYFGSSFVFFVPYLIPSDEGLSKSGSVTYRNYGRNEDQFFSLSLGMGFSPEINRFGVNPDLIPIVSLKSQKIGISENFRIKNNNNVIGVGLSLMRQESYFDPGKYYFIGSASLGYTFAY